MGPLLLAVALLASGVSAPTPPGEIIELRAYITDSQGNVISESRERLVVLNPLFKDRVFYVCGDWKQTMPGIRVRYMQRIGLSVIPQEGVTTNNGTIFTSHGGCVPMERTEYRF